MVSNFLGDVHAAPSVTAIISANELMTREGVNMQKSMNYRDDDSLLSVMLVLPKDGSYADEWHVDTQIYVFTGHDSITVESGKSVDQLMMYESGRLTDNGKFFKAANNFKDGARKEPLQVQVYEKLDGGVWYDKGIFNLIDASHVTEGGKKVFKFMLKLADAEFFSVDDPDTKERMLPAAAKAAVWRRDLGRCTECGLETGLRFVTFENKMQLRCNLHGAGKTHGLLG